MSLVLLVESGSSVDEQDALEAAGTAAVMTYMTSLEGDLTSAADLASWHQSPRKIVRRASARRWRQTTEVSPLRVGLRSAEILGWPVTLRSKVPQAINKTQVTGIELERAHRRSSELEQTLLPTVWLSDELGMSTGKKMAQVGHAAVRLWQNLQDGDRSRWASLGFRLVVEQVGDSSHWETLLDSKSSLVVRDGGHTELDRGTATAIVGSAFPRPSSAGFEVFPLEDPLVGIGNIVDQGIVVTFETIDGGSVKLSAGAAGLHGKAISLVRHRRSRLVERSWAGVAGPETYRTLIAELCSLGLWSPTAEGFLITERTRPAEGTDPSLN